jgi:hypothetical protein
MNMELDDLKVAWQRLDHRVQELTLINHRLMTDTAVRKARWRLAPLIAGAVVNVVVGIFFAVVSATVWSTHLESLPVLTVGIALNVLGIVFIVNGVGRLALAGRIVFTRPVLEIQRSLALLQRWEAWSFHAAWLACCLLPLAILIALAIATTGERFWERAPGYLVTNLLVWITVAVGPLLLYIASRRRHGRLAARMDALLTSHSIARARAAIEEIDDFEGS